MNSESGTFFLRKYEIQPEGPVQQITYVTEQDRALLRLIQTEDQERKRLPSNLVVSMMCDKCCFLTVFFYFQI